MDNAADNNEESSSFDSNPTEQSTESRSPRQPQRVSSSSPRGWLWTTGSVNTGSVPPPSYPLPFLLSGFHNQLPVAQDYGQGQPVSAYPFSQDNPLPPTPKIPIPRATTTQSSSQRRRSARACEPCRQRKVKCDAVKPVCTKCRESTLSCSYMDIKRVRDQKQLGSLSQKVERYEELLKQLESQVDSRPAKWIKKALSTIDKPVSDTDGSGSDSTSSAGSLSAIGLVNEDLNRSEKTVAAGFFGKNSEVSWMQRLEDESEHRSHRPETDAYMTRQQSHRLPKSDVPIMMMSYHLDDLSMTFADSIDPYALPPKELADRYFDAYMESVHPAFTVIRGNTFKAQYEQFFNYPSSPPRKWLAVLNMIFALGCRYCKLTGKTGDGEIDDLEYLNRARKLSLSGDVLFDHDDLQQIQVEFLVALYLLTLGQVNRASKFSSMAFRSAICLGINLRFEDDRTHFASREARGRLWWSIFLLEHLLTSITGRVSGVGEGLSAAPLPIPVEDGGEKHSPYSDIFSDQGLDTTHLNLTLLQTDKESQSSAAWLAGYEPSPSLFFHCFVDLSVITQSVINKIYSIQGLRDPAGHVGQRIQKYSHILDTWLHKVPQHYRFTLSEDDDQFHVPDNADHMRERVTLAISYYSARITLCRPCLSQTPHLLSSSHHHTSHTILRTAMTLTCLRASCCLLSILPDRPDNAWLTTVAPWWAILHFIMQATTALLIGVSTWPAIAAASHDERLPVSAPDISTMLTEIKKALHWLHHMSHTSKASRRAFVLCESFLRRIVPNVGLDIGDIPEPGSLSPVDTDINMDVDMLQMVGDG